MSYEHEVATITIDNPAKRNAMSAQMWRSLPLILSPLRRVRTIVLTGAGETFCAGADIATLASFTTTDSVAAEQALATVPVPTIARIKGDCIGGGCQLALACDLRVAAPCSRFGITPARLGVVYPAVSTRRLVRTVGLAHAKRLLLTGDLIDAQEALRIGLVHELVEDLDARVAELTSTLASRSLLSQAAMKQILERDVDEQVVHEWMELARDSGEAAEGTAAFLQRRPPEFPWRP